MTINDVNEFLKTVGVLAVVAGNIYVSWRNGQKISRNIEKTDQIKHNTDGMKNALVKAAGEKGFARGEAVGRKRKKRCRKVTPKTKATP